jgi:hypothetical protein
MLALPELFYISDRASGSAQTMYLRLFRSQIVLLFVASLIAGLTGLVGATTKHVLLVSNAVLLVIAFIVMWIIRAQRYESAWFNYRAIAESTKTAAWRYMTQAPPYPSDLGGAELDRAFLDELSEIQRSRPDSYLQVSAEGSPITDDMRNVRRKPLAERTAIYVKERLADQQEWYTTKARANSSAANYWFWAIAGIQTLGLAAAVIQASSASGPWSFNPVSVFMTLAASFLAWAQVKRFDELRLSYSLAAQELTSLKSLAPYASDQDKFGEFVTQAEEAISREHTMWCARRNIRLGR